MKSIILDKIIRQRVSVFLQGEDAYTTDKQIIDLTESYIDLIFVMEPNGILYMPIEKSRDPEFIVNEANNWVKEHCHGNY